MKSQLTKAHAGAAAAVVTVELRAAVTRPPEKERKPQNGRMIAAGGDAAECWGDLNHIVKGCSRIMRHHHQHN